MFKRLWQTGSHARFWAVTWNGDAGWPTAFHYHDNVYNAFVTAPYLASYVNSHGRYHNIIIAHSLGNMVVSSAIQDHNMVVNKYFMLNAAIPSEAFNPMLFDDSQTNVLVHEQWQAYTNRTWTCKWHELFPTTDDRSKLTWKGRFENVAPVVYNFYSSGDEVFELFNGTPNPLAGGTSSKGRYSWHKQEVFKGRAANVSLAWAATSWSGWGFSLVRIWDAAARDHEWVRQYTPYQANLLTESQLVSAPVFTLFPQSMNTNSIPRFTLDEHLAKGIPALSPSAGSQLLGLSPGHEFDLNSSVSSFHQNGWWRIGSSALANRWLHSDFRDVSYFYVFQLFERICLIGDL